MGKKIFFVFLSCLLIFTGCGKKEAEKSGLVLVDDLKLQLNSDVNLLSLISDNSTVEITSVDKTIDTSVPGVKELNIKYIEDGLEKEYKFKVEIVDTEIPSIQHINEFTTTVGTEINLLENVVVTDNSGEVIKATVEGKYDFNVAGTYHLTYVAIDSSNNKAVKNFVLYVNEKSQNNQENNSDVTYYRYREKIYNNYECGTYNCGYVDYNDTKPANIKFSETSPCGGGTNIEIRWPCLSNSDFCLMAFTPRYKTNGLVCYDSTYIMTESKTYSKTQCDAGEINIDGYCHKIESYGTYTNGCTTSDCLHFNETSPCGELGLNQAINTPCPIGKMCIQVMTPRYKVKDNVCYDSTYITVYEPSTEKTVCDKGEVNIDGYCHKIESTATSSCDSGYTKINDTTCAKNVAKTCTKTCSSESWSEWSEWSTTKVSPSSTVEVEIKKG